MRKFVVKVKSIPYEVEVEELMETDEFVIVQNPRYIVNSNKTLLKEAFKSPMAGKLVKTNVSEGEMVDIGQVLFVIEAMNFETDIVADRKGTVSKICAKDGQNVEAGDVLAFIE